MLQSMQRLNVDEWMDDGMGEQKPVGVIAVDLEGTLTKGETWRGMARWLMDNGYKIPYGWFFVQHLPHFALVQLGHADQVAFNVRWVKDMLQLFKGFSQAQFEQVVEWVVENETWLHRRQSVVDELWEYNQQGYQIVIVSGYYQPVAEAMGRRIGASTAIGTLLHIENDHLTGRFNEPVNIGNRKVDHLKKYVGDMPLVVAYGNTLADLPMLEMSQNPVAVAPDDELRAVAVKRGWRILEE